MRLSYQLQPPFRLKRKSWRDLKEWSTPGRPVFKTCGKVSAQGPITRCWLALLQMIPAQGLLLVIETSASGQRSQQIYLTAEKTGWLRILSVKGTQLSLSTEKGGKLTFDLETRAFTNP